MILVLYTTHLGANLEDDAVIRPIDLDDDAFLLSITLPSLQHALQEDACPCHLPERKTRRPSIGVAVRTPFQHFQEPMRPWVSTFPGISLPTPFPNP